MFFHYVGFVFSYIPLRGTPGLILGIACLLGNIALVIGFGIYAKGKGRSWAWSLLAAIGFLGLVVLLLLSDKTVNTKIAEQAHSA